MTEYVNEVTLAGTLAAAPEVRTFGSGSRVARLLISIRLPRPSRTDVLPVTVWEPTTEVMEAVRGQTVKVSGQVHRRFWTDREGRHSRIEIVVDQGGATLSNLGSFGSLELGKNRSSRSRQCKPGRAFPTCEPRLFLCSRGS